MATSKKLRKTKKVGAAGRFGPRYGRKIRDSVRKVEEKSKAKHSCPQCGKISLKRVSTGIWECTKCKTKLAGGAYVPQTSLGKISQRAVHGATKEEIMAAIQVEDKADEEKEKAKAKPASKKPKKPKKAKKAKAPKPEEADAPTEEPEATPAEEEGTPAEKPEDVPTGKSPTGDSPDSSAEEPAGESADEPVEEAE